MNGVALHRGPVRLSHGIQGEKVLLASCDSETLVISDAVTLKVLERLVCSSGHFVSCVYSPLASLIATGDTGNHVKSFWRGEKQGDSVLARLSLPPLCLAFSPSGTTLAAAGDADGIKLIDVTSNKVEAMTVLNLSDCLSVQVYRHLRPCSCVRGMAYDPRGVYLMIVTAQGTLLVWNLEEGEPCEKKTAVSRKVGGKTVLRCDWSPEGHFFCIPDATNGIGCFSRDTWQPVKTMHLPLVHTQPIVALSFSPNGAYLASGGEDKRVCIFHLSSSKLMIERKMEEAVTDLEWNPTHPGLTVATDSGTVYALPWDALCPDTSLPDPLMDVDLDEILGDCCEASVSEDISSMSRSETEDHRHGWKRPRIEMDDRMVHSVRPLRDRHGVIHPGSTKPCQDNKPFFFCWNSNGQIVVQSSERNNSIQILLSDTKLPQFLDFSGFTMGSLGSLGAVFASPGKELPGKGWKHAKLHHRSFNGWSHHAAWEVELLKEEIPICVAEGDGFCAVCTSKYLLRLFTETGLAIHVFSTPRHVICLVAKKQLLVMFFQTDGGEIKFQMYDVPKGVLKQQGDVHFGRLVWAGFSEESVLYVMDDEMCVYRLTYGFGCQWIPVLYGKDHLASSTETLFIVEIDQKKITVVRHQCHMQPQVQPPSILEDLPLSLPVLDDDKKEQIFLLSRRISEENTEVKKQNGQSDAEHEKMLLTMFNTEVKNGREEKALQFVEMMRNPLYIQGALRLANHNRQMILAEKISRILETDQGDPQSS